MQNVHKIRNDASRAVSSGGYSSPQKGAVLEFPASLKLFSPDEEIIGEGTLSEFIYQVVSGAVRITRLLPDGRRQIVAFRLKNDVFGLELDRTHRYCAEAIADTQLALVRRAVVEKAAEQNVRIYRQLLVLASGQLNDAQNQVLLLGRTTAAERVAAFLLEMLSRQRASDASDAHHAIDLPMNRADIADYLGLTVETVSRVLAQFKRAGAIRLPSSRHIILLDRKRLAGAQSAETADMYSTPAFDRTSHAHQGDMK